MTTVGVFLKYPQAGQVKTRLAKAVGNERAAQLYRQMLAEVFSTLDRLPPEHFATTILFDPFQEKKAYETLLGSRRWRLEPQTGESLGQRLESAAETLLDDKGSLILIGSDCVALGPEHFQLAQQKLDDGADVVLGPALDGGYYLIGMNKKRPSLFQNIEWSTDRVLTQTLQKIEALKLGVELLPVLEDIDTLASLRRSGCDALLKLLPA